MQATSTHAAVFTNDTGQVVFVDEAFLEIMKYSEAGAVTGEPLFKVLRVDQESGKRLLRDAREQRLIRNQLLEVTDSHGNPIQLYANIVATFDPNGKFLGADITLRTPDAISPPVEEATPEAKPAEAPALPAQPTLVPAPLEAGQNTQFIEFYFATHLKSLYILYQRLIGLRARDALDKLFNQTAEKNGWSLRIRNGLFLSDLKGLPVDAYRLLLRNVMGYGVNMIGQGVVARAVDKVDEQVHDGVLSLAKQEGLYQLYKNL